VTHADDSSLVDIHSHLVPNVDDGARDVRAVIAGVARMKALGIRRIVTTPHLQGSLTHEPSKLKTRLGAVTEAFDEAAGALSERHPDVEYLRGHEVLVDVPEPDLSDPRVRMAGTSFVLLEWPRLSIPPGTDRVLRRIRDQGYRPIVAHPERYAGIADRDDVARLWKDSGAYLQVNYGSLSGRYGKHAREYAFWLLEEGLADYMASDFHGHASLSIYRAEAAELLEQREAFAALDLLGRTNPARLLDDVEPLPVPALPDEPLLGRIKGMIGRRRRTHEDRSR